MDDRDFEGAVNGHRRRVFTLASYLLSDREEAADVTQEVLIRMWRKGRSVPSDRLGGWLLRVTRNACYDRLRRRRSAERLFVHEAPREPAASGAPDPEALARSAQFGKVLERELGELREPEKSAVVLREIQGLSYQQIADVLEVPVGTVRTALHRGRRRLRERLGKVYGDARLA